MNFDDLISRFQAALEAIQGKLEAMRSDVPTPEQREALEALAAKAEALQASLEA